MDYKLMFGCLVLLGLVHSGLAKPSPNTPTSSDYEGDDDYTYPDEDENKPDVDRTSAKDTNSGLNPPYFEKSEYSKTAKSGQTVVLECDVKNLNAENVIMWYNQSMLITQSNVRFGSNGRITVGPNSELTISDVHPGDEGLYQCEVMPNKIVLKVNLILFTDGAPQVTTHHRFVNTVAGDDADLHCTYNSTPDARISWHKDGIDVTVVDPAKYAIHNEHKHSNGHSRNTLVVKNVQSTDLGEYVCEVENSVGKAHAKIQLGRTPEPPKFVSIDIAEGVVVNHWSVRSHQPLTEVQLNYRKSGADTWLTDKPIHQEKSKDHSAIWKIAHKMSLANGVWHIQVRAKNDAGWSEFSEITETTGGAKSITEKHTSGADSLTTITSLLCLATAFVSFYQ